MDDLQKIFMGSEKAKLIEELTKQLETYNKAVIILIEDMDEDNKYASLTMTLGLEHTYEAYGILKVAEQDLKDAHY